MGVEYCILNLGQSNAEPQDSVISYAVDVPEMNYLSLTPDPSLSDYYGKAIETIRFLTFYNPEAGAAYPGGSPPAPFATVGWTYYSKFLPWTANEGAANPNITGFRYPNAYCLPRGPIGSAYATGVSMAVDLARRLRGHIKQRINVVTLAIGSTSLQSTVAPVSGPSAWGWFDPRVHNCWAPNGGTSLASRLLQVLDAAKLAATEEGNTLVFLFGTMLQGENDSIDDNMAALFGTNAAAFVQFVRDALYSRQLIQGSAAQFPFIWPKITTTPWGTSHPANVLLINSALAQMALDDPYFATLETDSFTKISSDQAHYSQVGMRQMAEGIFDSYLAIKGRATASLPPIDTPTLEQVRTGVRMLTERNTSDTGQTDATIDAAINDAYFDLINFVGDTCWWLRLTTPITITSSPVLPVSLPRCVTRLLEIRPDSNPWATIDYSMVSHTDNSRVNVITLGYWTNEPVTLHHMYEPQRVVAATERILLPMGYLEALKVGAARRVVENAGNDKLEAKLRLQEERLKAQVSQHANKVDRQRRQRLTGSRASRYGSRPNMNPWYAQPWVNG